MYYNTPTVKKSVNHYSDDYFTRNGIIQPLTYNNYFSIGHEETTREELIDALHKLTHNHYWDRTIRVCLSLAVALVAYVLLWITYVPQP